MLGGLDGRIAALAMVQCGLVARYQLVELAVTDDAIKRATRAGRWERMAPGVYLVAPVPPTWEQRVWCARLAIGGWYAVSHDAAAAMHDFATFTRGDVHLLVSHGQHPRVGGATVHQTRDPWLIPVDVKANLLITTPERTICDLAGTIRRARLALVVDDATARKQVTYHSVGEALSAIARPGKPGVRLLGGILDERGPGTVPPQSRLEQKTLDLFERFGGPAPKVCWPYPTREQVPGCADFGYDDALMALETDGRRWHQRIADLKRDHERDANAARHGVQVLRVLYEHVVGAPKETWELIQETREMRLRQLRRPA